MSELQVVLEDTFESGLIDATGNWLFEPTAEAIIADGIAIVKAGSTEAQCWHSTKIPDSTEQMIEAAVVAYVEGADKHVGLWLRLDDAVTISAFAPDRGYLCRLSYEASEVRKLEIIRINSGYVEVVLGTTADVGRQGSARTILSGASDLGVLQDLRFTVTDEDKGVRLRAFVNNDDDQSPDLSVLDLGTAATGSVPIRDAGFWGFEMKSATTEVGIDYIRAVDRFIVPLEDIHSARTLSQLRTDLNDEVTRGGNRSLSDAYLNRQLNLSVEEVMRTVRRASMFTLREAEMTLTTDDTDDRIVEMPNYIEAVEEIFTSPGRRFVGFSLVSTNESGTALRLRLSTVLSNEAVRVRYHKKWSKMIADDDQCIVPRLYDEVVILGAAKRIARRSSDQAYYQTIISEYGYSLRTMQKYLNRLGSMERKRFRVVPVRDGAYSRDSRYVSDPTDLWRWS